MHGLPEDITAYIFKAIKLLNLKIKTKIYFFVFAIASKTLTSLPAISLHAKTKF
jgi:hypothetical protein